MLCGASGLRARSWCARESGAWCRIIRLSCASISRSLAEATLALPLGAACCAAAALPNTFLSVLNIFLLFSLSSENSVRITQLSPVLLLGMNLCKHK